MNIALSILLGVLLGLVPLVLLIGSYIVIERGGEWFMLRSIRKRAAANPDVPWLQRDPREVLADCRANIDRYRAAR